jgi:hypothetical protein
MAFVYLHTFDRESGEFDEEYLNVATYGFAVVDDIRDGFDYLYECTDRRIRILSIRPHDYGMRNVYRFRDQADMDKFKATQQTAFVKYTWRYFVNHAFDTARRMALDIGPHAGSAHTIIPFQKYNGCADHEFVEFVVQKCAEAVQWGLTVRYVCPVEGPGVGHCGHALLVERR